MAPKRPSSSAASSASKKSTPCNASTEAIEIAVSAYTKNRFLSVTICHKEEGFTHSLIPEKELGDDHAAVVKLLHGDKDCSVCVGPDVPKTLRKLCVRLGFKIAPEYMLAEWESVRGNLAHTIDGCYKKWSFESS